MRAAGGIMGDSEPTKKLAVLVSGNGSNLQSIINAIESGSLNATIVCVVSNVPGAYALQRAQNHGIPCEIHDNSGYKSRRDYDTSLVALLQKYGTELVVLAGFMRILSDVMVSSFPDAIMNIHPALLPAFPGLHAQQQALDYGVKFSGCTVHFVDCGTDTGPIILQAVVPILDDDTDETLSARIQKEEHQAFPEAIRLFVDGRLSVQGRHVRIQE